MMQYLGSWQFWLAVIIVTFVAHWAINMVMSKMGGASA